MGTRLLRSIVAGSLLATVASAQDAAPEPTGDFLRAVASAPGLTAAARRIDAARERVGAAGLLPDPEIEGMGSRMDGPMGESSTMYEVNLRQPLPKRGERAADRERALAGVAMAEADFAVMAGEMAAEVAAALAEIDAAEARVRLLDAQIGRLDAVLRAVEIRIATGGDSRLRDRLTLQSQSASLQLRRENERRMQDDARAEARGRLGLPPDAPLPGFAAPAPADIEAAQSAMIRLAEARALEAEAMIKMARASARPMTAVGVRFERERTGMGNEDTVGLAVMSEIPWRGRRSARAETRAAEADRAAARTDAVAATHRIASALTRAERAARLADLSRRLGAETLGRLGAEYDAMIRGASAGTSGESTVFQVVELLEKTTEAELQVIEAEVAARTARAELWRYLPADRFVPEQS